MFPRLKEYLEKRGVKEIQELSEDEKATFDKWNKILNTKEIEIKDLEQLLSELREKAIVEIADPDNSPKKDAKEKAMITICDSLLSLIKSPKEEKEQLEKHLDSLLS